MELLLQANQMRWRTPFPSMPMPACVCVCVCVCVCWEGGLFSGAWRPLLSPTDLWEGPNERRVVVSLSASDRPHSGHSCAGPRCCFPTACWAAALLRGRLSHPLPLFPLSIPLCASSSSRFVYFFRIEIHIITICWFLATWFCENSS